MFADNFSLTARTKTQSKNRIISFFMFAYLKCIAILRLGEILSKNFAKNLNQNKHQPV